MYRVDSHVGKAGLHQKYNRLRLGSRLSRASGEWEGSTVKMRGIWQEAKPKASEGRAQNKE